MSIFSIGILKMELQCGSGSEQLFFLETTYYNGNTHIRAVAVSSTASFSSISKFTATAAVLPTNKRKEGRQH